MRLIDADALIEKAHEIEDSGDTWSIESADEFEWALDDYAPTIEPKRGEWIPCTERLPSNFSEDETVLATTDVDGDGVILMFAFDVKSFYLKGYINAWMPSPELWKGADDE